MAGSAARPAGLPHGDVDGRRSLHHGAGPRARRASTTSSWSRSTPPASASGRRSPASEGRRDVLVPSRLGAKHPFSLGGARELARIAREVPPTSSTAPTSRRRMPARHPLVVTIHDLTPLLVPGIMPSRGQARSPTAEWNRRAVHVADRIITDATFTVGEIERVFPGAAGRITAIPLGVDDFAAGSMGPLPSRGPAHVAERPYLLSMGSTRNHKDLPTLLSAFAHRARTARAAAAPRGCRRTRLPRRRPRGVPPRRSASASPSPAESTTRSCARSWPARGLRVPVALRGVRPAAARGDGARDAAGGRRCRVAARGVGDGALTLPARRCRRARGPARDPARRHRPRERTSAAGLARGRAIHMGAYGGRYRSRVPRGDRPPELTRRSAALRPASAPCVSRGSALRYPVMTPPTLSSTLGYPHLLKKITALLNDTLRIDAIRRMSTIVDVKDERGPRTRDVRRPFALFEGIGLSLFLPILQYAEGAAATGLPVPVVTPRSFSLRPVLDGRGCHCWLRPAPADAAGTAFSSPSFRSSCAKWCSTTTLGTRRSSQGASDCG